MSCTCAWWKTKSPSMNVLTHTHQSTEAEPTSTSTLALTYTYAFAYLRSVTVRNTQADGTPFPLTAFRDNYGDGDQRYVPSRVCVLVCVCASMYVVVIYCMCRYECSFMFVYDACRYVRTYHHCNSYVCPPSRPPFFFLLLSPFDVNHRWLNRREDNICEKAAASNPRKMFSKMSQLVATEGGSGATRVWDEHADATEYLLQRVSNDRKINAVFRFFTEQPGAVPRKQVWHPSVGSGVL